MMKIVNIYYWVSSKGATFSVRGDVLAGILGFVLPIFLILFVFKFLLTHCFALNVPIIIVVVGAIILDIPIYRYYKKNNRGKIIINYYDDKRINKWYYVALLEMFFVFLFFSFLLCGLLFVKLISKS